MKKVFALLAAALLTLSTLCFASPAASPLDKPVEFCGYVMGDFSGSSTASWIGFTSDDPSAVTEYDPLLSTYAAAYYEGLVYGFVYGYTEAGTLMDNYYVMDCKTHGIEFVEGAGSNGEFVYGMAFNYADGSMYALCNESSPYIARVDLETGALTKKVDINLGSYLGVMTLAIDGEGNFYLLSFSAVDSKLLSLDPETGALTAIMQTGMPCFYAQSMTWDHYTNKLYWAHVNERTSQSNGLYEIDVNARTIAYLGMIGGGMEITCLFTENSPEGGLLRGDVNCDGVVDSSDALLALRVSMGIIGTEGLSVDAGDLNGDGEISAEEALLIMRYAMGLSETL